METSNEDKTVACFKEEPQDMIPSDKFKTVVSPLEHLSSIKQPWYNKMSVKMEIFIEDKTVACFKEEPQEMIH